MMIHTLPLPTKEEYYKGYLIHIDTDPLLTLEEFIKAVFGLRRHQYLCTDRAKTEYCDRRDILVHWYRGSQNRVCVYGYYDVADFNRYLNSQHEVTKLTLYNYTDLINNDTTYGEL